MGLAAFLSSLAALASKRCSFLGRETCESDFCCHGRQSNLPEAVTQALGAPSRSCTDNFDGLRPSHSTFELLAQRAPETTCTFDLSNWVHQPKRSATELRVHGAGEPARRLLPPREPSPHSCFNEEVARSTSNAEQPPFCMARRQEIEVGRQIRRRSRASDDVAGTLKPAVVESLRDFLRLSPPRRRRACSCNSEDSTRLLRGRCRPPEGLWECRFERSRNEKPALFRLLQPSPFRRDQRSRDCMTLAITRIAA